MADADLEGFSEGIDDLVREVQRCVANYEGPRTLGDPASKTEQLSLGDCQRIRYAITYRHDPVKVREQLWGTEMAENIGYRFLEQLAAAETLPFAWFDPGLHHRITAGPIVSLVTLRSQRNRSLGGTGSCLCEFAVWKYPLEV